ncbi:MAG: HlyD family efflux transporter periplasmic adaptor subunit [Ktedonobacteraceae bacterium]
MRRTFLATILIVLAFAAIGSGIAYWLYNGYMFYTTDDAQVNGKIVNVSAPMAGLLSTLSVKQGDAVTIGQTIATITGAPATGDVTGKSTSMDISSPINGTVLQVSSVQGQGVSPGLTILQVTDLNALNVVAYVDENSINNVKNGQDVDVKIDAYSDTTFTGHVQQIVQATAGQFSLLPNQDPTSSNFTKVGQRIPVIVTLDGNGGKDIVPGMSASVTIHIH